MMPVKDPICGQSPEQPLGNLLYECAGGNGHYKLDQPVNLHQTLWATNLNATTKPKRLGGVRESLAKSIKKCEKLTVWLVHP